jgi:hypothetical protein
MICLLKHLDNFLELDFFKILMIHNNVLTSSHAGSWPTTEDRELLTASTFTKYTGCIGERLSAFAWINNPELPCQQTNKQCLPALSSICSQEKL